MRFYFEAGEQREQNNDGKPRYQRGKPPMSERVVDLGPQMCIRDRHDAKPVEATSSIHHKAGYWVPVHTWSIPLRDRSGAIRGIIQTFEAELSLIHI